MIPANLPTLDDLRVAAPCSARWDEMTGDDRTRFCASCHKTVYDLSDLTRDEALALVTRPGEAPCVRFYRRSDGTILTADCPVGLLARANRWRRRAVAAAVALLAGAGGLASFLRPTANPVDQTAGADLTPAAPISTTADASADSDLIRMPELGELIASPDLNPSASVNAARINDGTASRIANDLIGLRLGERMQPSNLLGGGGVSLGVVSFHVDPADAPAPPPPAKNGQEPAF